MRPIVLAVVLALTPVKVLGQGSVDRVVSRHLADGRRLYGDQDYAAVIPAMRRALEVPGVSEVDQLEAYEYIGCAYVILEDESEARRAFHALLEIDPYYVLREPTGSPKIQDAFDRVRREVVPDAALRPQFIVSLTAPRRAEVGEVVEIRAEPSGPVSRMTLRTRRAGEPAYDQTPMSRSGAAFRSLFGLQRLSRDYTLEYFVEARDAEGRMLGRGASPFGPRSIEVDSRRSAGAPAWYKSPWLWIAAGAVVTGAVVTAVALSRGRANGATCGTLTPGCVHLSEAQ